MILVNDTKLISEGKQFKYEEVGRKHANLSILSFWEEGEGGMDHIQLSQIFLPLSYHIRVCYILACS